MRLAIPRAAAVALALASALLLALIAPHIDASARTAPVIPATSPAAPVEREPAPPPAADLLLLRDRMAAAIDAYWAPGRYAVAVTDLQTGETVSVNGDRLQLSGCVINLFALLHSVRDVWGARYPQDAVESLIAATIWSSNPHTARELYRLIGDGDVVEGVRRVEAYAREDLGLSGVILDHPPAYSESIGINPDNWVTADAMNAALTALWRHEAIPEPSWREFLLYHMTQVKPGLNYLTAVTPALVSHKNGFLPASTGYVDNDVAIVRFDARDGERAYAITFLSEGVANEYDDIPLGQQLTYMAYEAMTTRYR
ncbi:MAG: serine hydrolase [Dehalococcoidia bacterium]